MGFDRRKYWEGKILPWEQARYGGIALLRPGSWTLRLRMSTAVRVAKESLPPKGRLLELGCGSGLFAERTAGAWAHYHGVDLAEAAVREARVRVRDPGASFVQADVLQATLPESDLAVFLGLLDWLEPAEAKALLARIPARKLLFSFTEETARSGALSPYGLYRSWYDARFGAGVYRARSYSWAAIQDWLSALGPHRARLLPARRFDPGRLVLVDQREAR